MDAQRSGALCVGTVPVSAPLLLVVEIGEGDEDEAEHHEGAEPRVVRPSGDRNRRRDG